MFAVIFGVCDYLKSRKCFPSLDVCFLTGDRFLLDFFRYFVSHDNSNSSTNCSHAGDLNPDPCFRVNQHSQARLRAHTLDDQLRVRFPSLSIISLATQKKKSKPASARLHRGGGLRKTRIDSRKRRVVMTQQSRAKYFSVSRETRS